MFNCHLSFKSLQIRLPQNLQRLLAENPEAGRPTGGDCNNRRKQNGGDQGQDVEDKDGVEKPFDQDQAECGRQRTADESGGKAHDHKLQRKDLNYFATRRPNGFTDSDFAHATVPRAGYGRGENNYSTQNGEGRQETNGEADSIHDLLDDLEDIRGVNDRYGWESIEHH